MHADYHQCVYDCVTSAWTPSGECLSSTFPEWKLPGIVHCAPDLRVSFIKRRLVFTQMALDQCRRLHIPVHFGQKVVKVEEFADHVIVRTASGEEYTGDLCVASTGIGGSPIEGFKTGAPAHVLDTKYAVARVCFPRELIKDDQPAAALLKNVAEQPEFRVYLANDVHLILFLTQDWVAYAFTHPVSVLLFVPKRSADFYFLV